MAWVSTAHQLSDTKSEEKLAKKTVQHKMLVEILKTYGYE